MKEILSPWRKRDATGGGKTARDLLFSWVHPGIGKAQNFSYRANRELLDTTRPFAWHLIAVELLCGVLRCLLYRIKLELTSKVSLVVCRNQLPEGVCWFITVFRAPFWESCKFFLSFGKDTILRSWHLYKFEEGVQFRCLAHRNQSVWEKRTC